MSEVNLIVKAGQLVPAHDQASIPKGAVAISGNRIVAIGTYDELSRQYPNAKHIGGDRFLLIPGLINGHGHGKGLSDFQRGAIDNTLESWLLDTRKYVPVSVYDDVAFSAIRLLKSGVTTTMHNHVLKDPKAYQQEFEDAIKAYADAGIRVQFNPGIRNDNPFISITKRCVFHLLTRRMTLWRFCSIEGKAVMSIQSWSTAGLWSKRGAS